MENHAKGQLSALNPRINRQSFCNFNQIEHEAWNKQQLVCGIDEAGRGCLAGPVVAAAVILPIGTDCELLRDSKKLSEKQRNQAFAWIKQHCAYAFALGSTNDIEQINILNCTKMAMQQAFWQLFATNQALQKRLGAVIIDSVGIPLTFPDKSQVAVPIYNPNDAENLSSSVAAASNVAKVMRDQILTSMHRLFPAYDLAQHKGYGTSKHLEKILRYNKSPIHRPKFVATAIKNWKEKHAK